MRTSTISGANSFKQRAIQRQAKQNHTDQALSFRGRNFAFTGREEQFKLKLHKELKKLTIKKSTFSREKRFNEAEIANILQSCKPENEKTLKDLLDAKTFDEKNRFDGFDIADILKDCKPENEKILKHLTDANTFDGKNRFKGYDILDILKYCRPENEKILKYLIDANTFDGKNRFDGYDIVGILKYCKPEKEKILKDLLDAKTFDEKNRFTGYEIADILKHCKPENEKILKYLLDAKTFDGKNKFNKHSITSILNDYKPQKEKILKDLLDGAKSLTECEITDLLKFCYPEEEKILKVLLDAKTFDGQNKIKNYEIKSILRLCKSGDEKFLKILLDTTVVDQNNIDIDEYGYRITLILKGRDQKPKIKELLDKLFDAKTTDGKHNRFSGDDIIVIHKNWKSEKEELLDKLIGLKTIDNQDYIFSGNDISDMFKNWKPEKEGLLDRFISLKTIDGKHNLFSGSNISDILKCWKPKNEKVLDRLIALKAIDDEHNRFSGNTIIDILKCWKPKNEKILDRLIALKSIDDQDYMLSDKNIYELFEIFSFQDTDISFLIQSDGEGLTREEKKSLLCPLSTNGDYFQQTVKGLKELGLENELVNEIIETDPAVLLRKVIKSLKNSVKVNPLSDQVRKNFFDSVNNIDKSLINFDFEKMKLDYPTQSFVSDLSDNLQGLTLKQKREVFNYYNFNLDDDKKLTGYPVVLDTQDESVKEPGIPEEQKKAIENVIKKFTVNNKITLSDEYKSLEADLNNIVKALPELLTPIGKSQHNKQEYSTFGYITNYLSVFFMPAGNSQNSTQECALNMHQLKVLKNFTTNSDYCKLTDNDKKIGKLAILAHVDSPIDAYSIMKKLKLSPFEHERVVGLIKNRHWSEELSNGQKTAEDIAFEFRKPGDFEIAKIFAEADLKSVNDNVQNSTEPSTSKTLEENLKDNINKVQPLVDKIQSTGVWLPRTRLSEKTTYTKNLNGVNGKLKIIDIKPKEPEDFYGVIHAIEPYNFTKRKAEMFSHLEDEGSEGVLSTSLVTNNKFNTFNNKKYGFVLELDPSNIAAISKSNMDSGYKKDTNAFKSYLFATPGNNYDKKRTEFSDRLKLKLKIDETKYRGLYKELSQKQDLQEVEASSNDPNSKLHGAYNSIKDTLAEFLNLSEHNELITYAAKPMAIFAKDNKCEYVDGYNVGNLEKKLNNMPQGLKEYAAEHDLPILNVTV